METTVDLKQFSFYNKLKIANYFLCSSIIATTVEDITSVWKEYFSTLLNVENNNELEEAECVPGPIQHISEDEVRTALRSMKANKALGPSGLTSDTIKCAGTAGLKKLTAVFQGIIDGGGCPDEWKDSVTVPLFKGKGDPLDCGKYRGLRLLEHGMKIYEKMLGNRLKAVVTISGNQLGFTAGRRTTDGIFMLRQIQQKYSERKKELYHIFVDFKKAFDRVPWAAIRWALRRQLVLERLVELVMELFSGSKCRVTAVGCTSSSFEITVGVHQGSALSPLLFNLVMEEATRECRRGVPWDMLYVDDSHNSNI